MGITMTECSVVIDGSTFITEGGSLVKLVNVVVPYVNSPNFEKPKEELEKLILNKLISFEEISKSNSFINAYVWVGSIYVNGHMQKLFPSEKH